MKTFLRENFIALAALAAAALILVFGLSSASGEAESAELAQTERAIRRAAASCYAIEGAYPPDADYLAENYGATYDRSKYAVDYRVFASNIFPEITVLRVGTGAEQ